MSALVQLARVLLILLLATVTISSVIGLGRPETGLVEKAALVALITGCVVLAGKVSILAAGARERPPRR